MFSGIRSSDLLEHLILRRTGLDSFSSLLIKGSKWHVIIRDVEALDLEGALKAFSGVKRCRVRLTKSLRRRLRRELVCSSALKGLLGSKCCTRWGGEWHF